MVGVMGKGKGKKVRFKQGGRGRGREWRVRQGNGRSSIK